MSHHAPSNNRRPRRRIAAAVAVSIVLLAASCGSDDDRSSSTAAPTAVTTPITDAPTMTEPADTEAATEPASTASTTAGTFPVSVEHAFGTTEIPSEPVRIVSVGLTEQDTLLALGIVPVGITDWYGDQPYGTWPWAQDLLGDAKPELLTGTGDGIAYEAVAALEPDLIIGTNAGLDEATYETLSAIAPTIAQPDGAESHFSPWEDQSRLIAEAVGKSAEMEALIADIKAQFADAAAEHPEFAGTNAIFLQNAFYDGSAIAYQEGLSTAFLTDLGFSVPSEIDQFQEGSGQAYIPLEQLGVLDTADVLIWGTEGPDDRLALEGEPLYMALEEVRDGRLVFTDGLVAGAIYFTSVLSLPFVLEHLVPALASTLEGAGPAEIDAVGDLADS